jgi:hypothetical protein
MKYLNLINFPLTLALSPNGGEGKREKAELG